MPFGVIHHQEPVCINPNNGCLHNVPHSHGLECDDSCVECEGKCHPTCPAYSMGQSNRAFESFIQGTVDARVSIIVPLDEENRNGPDQ